MLGMCLGNRGLVVVLLFPAGGLESRLLGGWVGWVLLVALGGLAVQGLTVSLHQEAGPSLGHFQICARTSCTGARRPQVLRRLRAVEGTML